MNNIIPHISHKNYSEFGPEKETGFQEFQEPKTETIATKETSKTFDLYRSLTENGILIMNSGDTLQKQILKGKGRTYVLFTYPENNNDLPATNTLLQLKHRSKLLERHDDRFIYANYSVLTPGSYDEVVKSVADSHCAKIHEYDTDGKLLCKDVENELNKIKLEGGYFLVSNGNYEEYLSTIGIDFVARKVQLCPFSVLMLERLGDEEWEIKMDTTIGTVSHRFKLGQKYMEKTGDGLIAQAKVEKVLNVFVHYQWINDTTSSVRRTIRIFTKKELHVTIIANKVRASRRYKRLY